MHCSACGRQISEPSLYCQHCGTSVADSLPREWQSIIVELYEPLIKVAATLLGAHGQFEVVGHIGPKDMSEAQVDWFRQVLDTGGWQLIRNSNRSDQQRIWQITRWEYRRTGRR